MNDTSVPTYTSNTGMILCRDTRLCRLFETELAYLGILSAVCYTVPPSAENVCIVIADGDDFDLDTCLSLATACCCPLLIFGRDPAELPADRGQVAFLRRPFALTELNKVIRSLMHSSYAWGSLRGAVATGHTLAEVAERTPATLTACDHTVTVGDRTVVLTPAEWAIFEFLHARLGQVVTREQLSELLGGGGHIVDVYVCRLRAKIEKPLGRRMIWTVRGKGYQMRE